MAGTLAQRLDRLEKNYLINGGMDFFQRGGVTSAVNTSTSSVYSSLDRWKVQHTGTFTGTPNIIRDSSTPNNMVPYSMKHNFQRNASTAVLTYEQRIESAMVQEMADFGYGSFSVWVNAPVAGSLRLTLLTPTVRDNHASQTQQYQSTQTIPVTAAWTLMTFPAIPMAAATNLGLAVRVEYVLASGTDGSAVNFWMTQAMLNPGKVCSDFNRYGSYLDRDLLACNRYYEKSYAIDVTPGTGGVGSPIWRFNTASTTQLARVSVQFTVRKWAGVGTTLNTYSAASGGASGHYDANNVSATTGLAISADATQAWVEGSFTVTANTNNTFGFCWTAETEL